MLKHENIICISSIDWDFIWQGHQEIMAYFAKNGNRVLFIENTGVRRPGVRDISRIKNRIKNWFKGVTGIRREKDNLYVFSPIVLPFPYSRIAMWINHRLILSVLEKWMKIVDFSNPIVWTFLPTGLVLDLINNINNKLVVYYCIADFEKLVRNPARIRKSEIGVIKASDLIFVQGQELKRRCEAYNKKVTIFPFGVNMDRFNEDSARTKKPPDIKHIKGTIIGYVGGIHKHVDFALIRFLAERNRKWTFLFIGPMQTDISEVEGLENIIFLEQKEHKELANYINSFDVSIVPYLLNEYTETVYPTKINEYLAMGKPVVATALPEVVELNKEYGQIIYIGSSKEDFEEQVKNAMKENNSTSRNRYIEVARDNSWDVRIEKMSQLMQEEITRKKIDTEAMWKENLINFYKIARKKIWSLVISCVLLYFLLFNTPFLWFLASPLKISEAPQKADVILVFGGGVGETGSPGKSTIERARYAAELYKQDYSNKVLFSSGYTYVYNDSENMKLFAVSTGVLEKDILLEQKANNTYENVLFSKQLLDKYHQNSVILISSPYNMRRVQLVFKKLGNNIKVIYAPVQDSQFYNRSNGIKLEQIKAIMHEYLGIVYYWIKGYI